MQRSRGTLMDENISRAAGADHGQELDEDDFRGIATAAGRPLEQRTTLYGRITTVGRRLHPIDPPIGAVPVTIKTTVPVA